MKKKLCILLKTVIILTGIIRQDVIHAQLPDGSDGTSEYLSLLTSNLNDERQTDFDSSRTSSSLLSIYVFVVNNIEGEPGVTPGMVNSCLNDVNYYFKPAGLQFQVSGFDTVMEYEYSSLSVDSKEKKELLTKYGRKNIINLFLVDTLLIDSINYYGYSYFPDNVDSNYIFLQKDVINTNALITQLGHFFGLLSTYNALGGGFEYVDGSNCDTSGDFICDTDADPGILGGVSDECEYNGARIDPKGDWYVPSVANFMTNGPFECKCIFTPEQYRRIVYYYKNYRSYLR
jgi:hypothetical protein